MTAVPGPILATATRAADLARQITRRYFRTPLAVENKQDTSPVTIADRKTEQAIKTLILEQHPDHGFFGEESGNEINDEEWCWIIDPIDGTKSFATGKPTFGTLIAVLKNQAPVLGIIDHGILDERWIGVAGEVTTLNGAPCHTSSTAAIVDATVYTTTLDMFDQTLFDRYNRLSTSCRFRAFGGDCYSYGLLASGFTDLVCEADLKPYDYLALVPVIEGAGGIISDWAGNPLSLHSEDTVLASANTRLHRQALQLLSG